MKHLIHLLWKNTASTPKEPTRTKSESSFNFQPFNSTHFRILCHVDEMERYKDNEKKHAFLTIRNY